MKLATVPFNFKGEGYLGKIYRPYIQVLVTSKKIDEWIPVEMVVDTGADYTLLPKKYAQLLEVNLDMECKMEKTQGVGGQEEVYLCKRLIKIKISNFEKLIPVGFLNRDNIPPLLGRLHALEILKLVMKNKVTTLEV